jgi:guanosine-3',5'-bis(diphosphate) 3'-pyrophosphohydrolase
MTNKISTALLFAANAHIKQKRKLDQSSYINHLIEVLNILSFVEITDEVILISAILHDTVEDTSATLETVRYLFGSEVAELVALLSEDKKLSKEERFALTQKEIGRNVEGFIAVKLADLISNISAIPSSWDLPQKERYLAKCKKLLASVPEQSNVRLLMLIEVAFYVYDAQTSGSSIYTCLCDWAVDGTLYWDAKGSRLIKTEEIENGTLKGFHILGGINMLFELGLLRSLEIRRGNVEDIEINSTVDENMNVIDVAHINSYAQAVCVTIKG